jgi:flavodoxin I
MKALVVYDSFFGNTERIAQAIGKALAAQGEAKVLKVGQVEAERLTGVDLLVVGSPTRAFSPSPAITKLLRRVPRKGLSGVRSAAFDTRLREGEIDSQPVLRHLVKVFGYAAEPIAKRLGKKGAQPTIAPEGFIVDGVEGPLKDGELERAADWARRIAAAT